MRKQALAKGMDVCLNGVDVLQKHLNRLRIRYSLIKAQFTERDGMQKLLPRSMQIARLQHHRMTMMMQRQRKMCSSPVSTALLSNVTELATYHYRSVRIKAQPALISCTRRYHGACARVVPVLVSILEDKGNSGHAYEQRVVGAANLLQTGALSKRILRDWGMLRRFLLALCRSDHIDKVHLNVFNLCRPAYVCASVSFPQHWPLQPRDYA